jgi:phosphatidylserine decarboxylase
MICKAGHYEPIAREGHIFVVPPLLLSFLLWWLGHPWISLGLLVLACLIAMFFRNPERVPPHGDGIVISPCDGRVVEIVQDTDSDNIPGEPLQRMSIFMSIFNVHVNRWPVSGVVQKIEHVDGSFLDARDPKASSTNEHNSVVVQSGDKSMEVVQIAGKIARRIACWVYEGDRVQQGDRFGLIRFGSRVDVYLPKDFSFVVPIGTKVRAGVTIIARETDA